MDRKFGIELEIVGITQDAALKALKAVGIKVCAESYNHITRNHWKIVPDGSVLGGFEVVSPILKGEAGIEMAEIVARALEDAGANANKTCGFHVHFDAAGLSTEQIKTILRRYARHESEIDSFMPKSRRGNENNYCRSLQGLIGTDFENAATTDALVNIQPSRYYKVNLKSYQRHGTIEFRQHSGTVNAMKICAWVRFLGEFINECVRLQEAGTSPAFVPTVLPIAPQGQRLASMLGERFMSLSDICMQFGWLEHTARAALTRLRKAGFNVVSHKQNGERLYTIEAVNQEDSLWNGISRKITLFYQRRAAVLATAA